jgi:hypothetical protein
MAQELGIFGFEDQIVRLDVWRQRDVCLDLCDVGLYVLCTKLPGNGDPVIPVEHKVDLVELIHLDGWQASKAGHRQLDPDPPPLITIVPRPKGPRKIGAASYTAGNRIYRYVLQASRRVTGRAKLLPYILVYQALGRSAAPAGHNLL